MNDIFISYASEDLDRVRSLVEVLEGQGWSVFWDRTIPSGKTWREVIGKGLRDSRCIVVVWSKASIESTWVQEEADEGRERGILHPVLIDAVKPPLGFRAVQAANLVGWEPGNHSLELDRFLKDLGKHPWFSSTGRNAAVSYRGVASAGTTNILEGR